MFDRVLNTPLQSMIIQIFEIGRKYFSPVNSIMLVSKICVKHISLMSDYTEAVRPSVSQKLVVIRKV